MKLKLLLIFFILFNIIKVKVFSQNNLCFNQPLCSPFLTSSLPNDVVSADFNLDGKNDLAVEIQGSDSITILLGNNNGCFTYAYSKKIGSDPLALTKADFNNDGKTDLVVANALSNNISILINNGNGFNNAVNFIVGPFPIGITVGDLNSDGNVDVVTANNYAGISVLFGMGTGSLAPAVNYTVGSYPRTVGIGDFNSDGKNDIVVGHDNSSFLCLLINNGSGVFNSPINFGSSQCPYLIIADMNLDSKPDVVASLAGSVTSLCVFYGDGASGFASTTTFPILTSSLRFTVNDFNLDGLPDIACGYFISYKIDIFTAPSFGTPLSITTPMFPYPTSGDFNGDGKPDIATANRNADNVSVFLNQGLVLNFTPLNPTICKGQFASISASGASSYSWSTSSNSSSISVNPITNTVYTVTGTNGSCTSQKTVTVIVNPNPTVTAISNKSVVCSGGPVTISASGANSYTWNNSSTNSSISVTPVNSSSTNISINYSVSGANSFGCISSSSLTVVTMPSPTVNILAGNDTVCLGQSSNLIANIVGGIPGANSIYWNDGSSTQSIIISPTTNTTYICVVTSSNSCIGVTSKAITISSCVGIEEINVNNISYTLFPNPFNDKINIAMLVSPDCSFQIFNTLGATIYSGRTEKGKAEIDLSNQPAGVYFVKAGTATKKIIKQ